MFTIGAVEQLAQQIRDRGDFDIAPGVVLLGTETEVSTIQLGGGCVELIYTIEADEPSDLLAGIDLSSLSIDT